MERTLMAAIALSCNNKAVCTNGRETIVVQELVYSPEMRIDWCFHVWIISDDNSVSEKDMPREALFKLKGVYEADPSAEIWTSI